jgi:co-chaperonin GroES (HSP10)
MPSALKAAPAPVYDPKKEILDRLGDLSGYEIAQNEVLLAIYMRPEKTAGGIILTQNNLKEDKYQGKAHLVVKIGNACRFQRTDPDSGIVYGLKIALHDWVVVNPSHAWSLDINPNPETADVKDFVNCRMCFDDQIRAKVADPRSIY